MERELLDVQIFIEPHARELPLPEYATSGAAGVDLRAAIDENCPVTVASMERVLIPTGIRIAIPQGFEAQVRARSGLAIRHGVGMVNAPGTIDSDYRGEIKVILINWGKEPFIINRGDRIAQLVFAPVCRAEFTVSNEVLETTERSEGGFGSTGVN
jgi:dUTP pyrophosphatase